MSSAQDSEVTDAHGAINLESLLSLFSWHDSARFSADLTAAYRTRMHQGLEQAITLIRGAEDTADRLQQELSQLAEPNLIRLLTAPEFYCVLVGGANMSLAEAAQFICRAVHAEWHLCHPGQSGVSELWTALGDCRIGSAPAMSGQDVDANEQSWTAPRIEGGIPVDWRSPFALRKIEPNCKPDTELTAEEVDACLPKLNSAMQGIREANPKVSEFISRFTRVIVLQWDPQHPDLYRSYSTNGAIGRTLLINAHLETADVAEIADSLIHEAIHDAVCIYELVNPLVWGPIEGRAKVISPWTGNKLPVHPFIHACFVWFGLVQFWKQDTAGRAFPEERARDRFEFAARGFANDPVFDTLSQSEGGLSKHLYEVVGAMRSRVRGAL